MNEQLEELLGQEAELQFTAFSEETAWEVGSRFVQIARDENLPIAVDITMAGRQLFHASRPGAAADNDEWIKRKVRLVNRMGHSSYYLGRLLASQERTIEDAWLIPRSEYAPHGGCFPIILSGTGVVGTVTVSGLAQAEDHALVVRVLREFV